MKLTLFSIAIMLVIPTGIRVSDLIEDTYQASIAATIQEAKDATDTIQNSQSEKCVRRNRAAFRILFQGDGQHYRCMPGNGAVEKLRNVLNRFLEALAVMLVTTCLIPILVLLLFRVAGKTHFGRGSCRRFCAPAAPARKSAGERPDIRLQFRQICGMLEKRTAWSGT